MTILNLMLGKGRGGLEQASADYAEVLALAKIDALTVISPGAWVEAPLVTAALPHESLPNANRFDPIAVWRLRRSVRRTGATAIICHGNRALKLALKALNGRIPVIAVAHNAATRHFARADVCFAITEQLVAHLASGGAKQVFHIPNMVRVPEKITRPMRRTPPVIGAMGRFDTKKGFDVFIDALAILTQRGVAYRAVLGGDGEERDVYRKRIHAYGLEQQITLPGWVQDKHAFFHELDLYVMSSRQEAFGLTLVEAMAHAVPVVTTDANGPREIAHDGKDALVVPRDQPEAMAAAILRLLEDTALAEGLGNAGRALALKEYTPQAMAARLQTALSPYMLAP